VALSVEFEEPLPLGCHEDVGSLLRQRALDGDLEGPLSSCLFLLLSEKAVSLRSDHVSSEERMDVCSGFAAIGPSFSSPFPASPPPPPPPQPHV
jgi:hypothetical protein